MTGYTFGGFPTVNAIQPSFGGAGDAFVAKINPSGSALVYSSYLGGSGLDMGNGIAVDSSGNAYVTGNTDSTNFPTANAIQPTLAGPTNVFITKINASDTALVYSTYLGGSGDAGDSGSGIAVDSSGDAFVTGTTNSTDFPAVNDLQSGFRGPGSDAFITEINSRGSAFLYSTYFGDYMTGGSAIAVDSAGDAYLTGFTGGGIPLVNAFQSSVTGFADTVAFVAKILSGLNISPSAPTFVNQPVGFASAPLTIALGNSSNAAVTISSLSISGTNGSEFSETDNYVGSLPEGASCSINVIFTPAVTGSQTGTLVIANSLTSSPLLVPLTGTGVAVARNAVLSVNSLTFTSEVIGATTPAQSVTLSNNGNETLLFPVLLPAGPMAQMPRSLRRRTIAMEA